MTEETVPEEPTPAETDAASKVCSLVLEKIREILPGIVESCKDDVKPFIDRLEIDRSNPAVEPVLLDLIILGLMHEIIGTECLVNLDKAASFLPDPEATEKVPN
jgi:hypothetical protein